MLPYKVYPTKGIAFGTLYQQKIQGTSLYTVQLYIYQCQCGAVDAHPGASNAHIGAVETPIGGVEAHPVDCSIFLVCASVKYRRNTSYLHASDALKTEGLSCYGALETIRTMHLPLLYWKSSTFLWS